MRDLPASVVAAAAGPTAASRLVAMPEWMQCATRARAEAAAAMKRRGGIMESGGRPLGRKPTPSGLSPGAESNVLTLREVTEYLHCSYALPISLSNVGIFPASDWAATGGF